MDTLNASSARNKDDIQVSSVAQAHRPVTLDLVESQQQQMAQLGSTVEATAQRNLMHSDALLADMKVCLAARYRPSCGTRHG